MKHIGAVPGKAVAQVCMSGAGWEAPKRLGGFAKLNLAPGSSRSALIVIDPRLLATFDVEARIWKIAGGDYDVMLGTSAADLIETVKVHLDAQSLDANG